MASERNMKEKQLLFYSEFQTEQKYEFVSNSDNNLVKSDD